MPGPIAILGESRVGRRRLAFGSAVVTLTAAFGATAVPVPLLNIYREDEGFTNAAISMTVVAYMVGTIVALLVLGRLSSHVGRRPVAIATLALLIIGSVVLLDVHSITALFIGRLLMGVAAGLASTGMTSYVVDTAPTTPGWLASVASSQGSMLGITLGAVGSGALVQYAPWPRTLVYLVVIVMLLVCSVLIVASPETVTRNPGVWASLRPRIHVPVRVRHLVPVAAVIFLATWAMGAFYQAFVPALTIEQLGNRNALVIGLVFAAYMAPSVLGAPIVGRFSPAGGQRLGMIVFVVGMVGIISALATGGLLVFIAASSVAGAGQGIAVSASVHALLHGSSVVDRAPIFAAIYVLCYSGAALPSLISGELSHHVSLFQLTLGYGALAVLATAITLVAARDPD